MDKKKRNIMIIGGVVVLVVIIIVFIVMGNMSGGLLSVTNKNYIDKDAVNADWMNYLLNQDITKIELIQKGTFNESSDEDINTRKRTTLTVDELKQILIDIQNYEINKMYALGLGESYSVRLTVTYKKWGKTYLFEIYHNSIFVEQCDTVLQNTIENKEYPELYTEFKDMEGVISFYNIDGLTPVFFDDYFD